MVIMFRLLETEGEERVGYCTLSLFWRKTVLGM